MLKKVVIENFRCLRHVDVPLKPLTVLIGPNDSGKTTFLCAISKLASEDKKTKGSDHWRRDQHIDVLLEGELSDGMWIKSGNPKISRNDQNLAAVKSHLLPARFFQLPSTGVEMQCQGFSGADEQTLPLGADGQRVPAFFDSLLRRDRNRFFQIVDALRQFIPGLDDVDIATPKPELRRIDLVIENGLRIPANSASAGVRLLLFFVAIAYHPMPPKLILLEEPENGIHPKRLTDVVKLLRAITQGKHGEHAAQVILTTHSPYLLDCVDLESDQVLVFQRNDDGSRSAQPVDAERLKTFTDEFMLGEVWFNETEAGLVANPS